MIVYGCESRGMNKSSKNFRKCSIHGCFDSRNDFSRFSGVQWKKKWEKRMKKRMKKRKKKTDWWLRRWRYTRETYPNVESIELLTISFPGETIISVDTGRKKKETVTGAFHSYTIRLFSTRIASSRLDWL